MTAPTFTAPPLAPSRGDPSTFNTRFAAWLNWLAAFVVQLINGTIWMDNAASAVASDAASAAADAAAAGAASVAALSATGYVRRSTANLTVGAGAKAITGLNVPGAAAFANDDEVLLVAATNAEIRQWGVASAVNAGAGTMTVTVAAGDFAGAGPIANWIVAHRAFESLISATAADVLAASSAILGVTPKAQKDALTRFVLTDGAPVTGLSGLNGLDFFLQLTTSRTLPQLTNTYPGARGTITAKQPAGGSALLAVHSSWKRRGGLGVLSTAGNAEDEIPYEVKTVDGSGNATRVIYDVLRAPS